MNYAITPEGTIVEVGDKAVVKGYEVFSNIDSLREAIEANRLAHFKKHNPFVHAKKLWGALPQRRYKADLGGFEQVLSAIARLTFAAHKPGSKAARASASAPAAKKARASKAAPAKIEKDVATRTDSKKSQVINMLRAGTTREAIAERMGWLPHTVRGLISTLAKTMTISMTKTATAIAGGPAFVRIYKIEE